VRGTGSGVLATDPYAPGFFLPALQTLKEPVSIILPPGWFVPGRIVEVVTDRPVLMQLTELLTRGANFERCTFTLVS
jgi:hypothetical protein